MGIDKYVQKVMNNYTQQPAHKTPVEELKELDKKVKTPALVFAYIFGVLGTLILGTGMCLAMDVFALASTPLFIVGIVVGVVGITMVSINYAIYSKILSKRKAKYADQIIEKGNQILNNN